MRGMTRGPLAFLLATMAAAVACGQGDGEGGEGERAPGGGTSSPVETSSVQSPACTPAECVEGEGACEGDDRVTCVGGKKVHVPCTDAQCAAEGKGPLLGCLLDDADKPSCVCGCTNKDNSCVDAKVLSACSTSSSLFKIECTDELCKQQGYKGLKAGSGCKSSSDGAYCDCELNCDPNKILCNDSTGKAILTLCDGQSTSTVTCDEVCAKDGEVASPTCSGVNETGDKVCFCGVGKCSVEGAQQCVGETKLRYCENGVWLEVMCSDAACKKSGFSGWSGQCGPASNGKESCLCNN